MAWNRQRLPIPVTIDFNMIVVLMLSVFLAVLIIGRRF
jgi:hypothetical protein